MECGPACPQTCDYYDKPCPMRKCNRGCFCKDGNVRNKAGRCVPGVDYCKKQCKGKHEIYAACGTECPNDCTIEDECKTDIIGCVKKCYCEKGYIRNYKGVCIKKKTSPIDVIIDA